MAVKTYLKANTVQLSANFNSYEFRCGIGRGCNCTTILIDDLLWQDLQRIRDFFGVKVTITSGYRCPTYNLNVGGAVGSYHSRGMAADIVVDGVPPRVVAAYAESIGILGIGLYEGADGDFVHIDKRTYKSFWYGKAESPRTTFGGAAACAGYGKNDSASGSANTHTSAEAGIVYTVKSGDTLAKIAAKYPGVTYKQIADLNGIKSPYVIYVGQKLTIPNNDGETTTVTTPSSEYSVADYDSSPDFLWPFFMEKIGNAYGVAGLLGNLNAESNLIAANLEMAHRGRLGSSKEYTDAVDSGKYNNFASDYAGYGIAQWTDKARKSALLAFAKGKSASIGNKKMQAEYLMSELEGRFSAVLNILKNAASVREASNAVLMRFECPADQSIGAQDKRTSYGERYYNQFFGTSVGTTNSAVTMPYVCSVTADLLNVRSGPGLSFSVIRRIVQGTTCTIVDESDGWGKIMEGEWISLKYVK